MSGTAMLFHQPLPSTLPLAGKSPAPMADPASGSDSSTGSTDGTGAATITANDFLTLLVTEMRNQDPTAQTDPNEYINQLVAVNSLQQLIGINQTLTSSLGTSTDGYASAQPFAQSAAPTGSSSGAASHLADPGTGGNTAVQQVQGNLGIPAASGAAGRLAHALDGHAPSTHSIPAVR